jgi:hypothetical protein
MSFLLPMQEQMKPCVWAIVLRLPRQPAADNHLIIIPGAAMVRQPFVLPKQPLTP